jgi:signal transduction histidine kinase
MVRDDCISGLAKQPTPFGPLIFRQRRIRPQHAVIVVAAVLVIAYGASTCLLLRNSREQTLGNATATLESMARSAETCTRHSLFEIDAVLLGVDRMLATVFSGKQWEDPSVKALLRQFDEQKLAVTDLLILDDKGREVNRSRSAPGRAQGYADSAFFTAHHSAGDSALFIGSPERSDVSGDWFIMLSRPLTRGNIVRGVIAAEVPIATFEDVFSAIALTGTTQISLLLDDGMLIASGPNRQQSIGRMPTFAPALLAAVANAPAGVLEDPPDEEGGGWLRSFRRVPGHPLMITVARERSDILRQWDKEMTVSVAVFALLTCAAVTLAVLVLYALKRQGLAAARLRQGEARLRRQTSLLQSTLENIGEGLSVFDSQGRLVARNSRFCELVDLPPDLEAGALLRDILTLQAIRGDFGGDDSDAEIAARFERFYRDVPTVKERVTSGGRILQIRRRAMPEGAVVSVYSDVTDIQSSERKLIQARSQAEMANRSKSDFLANMSHELRTPLNAIIGFSEIISHELFGPMGNKKYLEYMKDIHKSSLHLLSIINDVLDMSKIEAGKLELSKEALNIENVITDVIRMMNERAASRGIELIAQPFDAKVDIWADERAMKQIFLNLLSNAIKFSKEGDKVYVRVIADQPALAVVEFEDFGIGMDEEEQERAVQPFGQAKPATTRNYGGTGLGLPITKGLVEAHGGKLTIKSRPGCGTVVRVMLPTESKAMQSITG